MMRNSQMVAAFGRRLFDEGELKETTTEEEDEDAEEVNQWKSLNVITLGETKS